MLVSRREESGRGQVREGAICVDETGVGKAGDREVRPDKLF